MEVREITVNREDVEFIVGKSNPSDENTTLSLFKNENAPWVLTDGWRGISYFISDEGDKARLKKLNY